MSTMQLSVGLDLAAEAVLTVPAAQHEAAGAETRGRLSTLAARWLAAAVALEPEHNAKAAVFRAALGRMLGDRDPAVEAAARAAIERVASGGCYWYRLAGAHGGLGLDGLRERLGLPPPTELRDGAGRKKGRSKAKRKRKTEL